jgi:hypothetical protein
MPVVTVNPKTQLQQWFQYLQAFQTACEQESSSASNETLSTFANDTIVTDLPSPNDQQNFLAVVNAKVPFTVTPSDIAASSTFESLLENVWTPLSMCVLGFIKFCAPPAQSTMGYTDFAKELLTTVFPGEVADANWIVLQNGLTSSIPSSCYSSNQQKAANNLVVKKGSTIQNLTDLISKLG